MEDDTPADEFQSDGAESAEESFDRVVMRGIGGHARSHQRVIGPSGLGTPCPRKLAYLLAQSDPARRPETEWRQTVGTGVHAWVENVFNEHAAGEWLTERKVYVGDIVTSNGITQIRGTSDLFHIPTGTVVDVKVPGPEGLKKIATQGPSQTYSVQGQLYGVGYANAGYTVRRIAIAALPAAGEWRQRVWAEFEFRPGVAEAGLTRAGRVLQHIEDHGLEATLAKLKPVDDFCRRCEFARPAEGRSACPTATPREAPTTVGDLLKKKRR